MIHVTLIISSALMFKISCDPLSFLCIAMKTSGPSSLPANEATGLNIKVTVHKHNHWVEYMYPWCNVMSLVQHVPLLYYLTVTATHVNMVTIYLYSGWRLTLANCDFMCSENTLLCSVDDFFFFDFSLANSFSKSADMLTVAIPFYLISMMQQLILSPSLYPRL